MTAKTKTKRVHLKKGQVGELDDIYHLMGIIPSEAWGYVDDTPDSDLYVILKTITISIKITVTNQVNDMDDTKEEPEIIILNL